MNIDNVLKEHGIGANDIVLSGKNIPIGSYRFTNHLNIEFERPTVYNTNRIDSSAFNPITGEIWSLCVNARTISVYKDNVLSRTINIPPPTDVNFSMGSLTHILINKEGRVYICGKSIGEYYSTITEINPNSGVKLNQAKVGAASTSITVWLAEIIDDEIWISTHTGRLDVFSYNLELIKSYLYTNSVGNTQHANVVDKLNDRVVYSQTANNVSVIKKLSDGVNVATIPFHYMYFASINGYLIGCLGSVLSKYDMNGVKISEMSLTPYAKGVTGHLFKINGHVGVSYHNKDYGYVIIDVIDMQVIYNYNIGNIVTEYQTHTYHTQVIAINKKQIVTQFPARYGLYTISHKLRK